MEPELKKSKEEWMRDLEAALARGMADIEAGRTIPAEEVFAELRARFKIPVGNKKQKNRTLKSVTPAKAGV